MAVWLIKEIRHPVAIAWIPEFLADPSVNGVGMDVLDQLIFAHRVDPESEEVANILGLADQHQLQVVQDKAAFIKSYIATWIEGDSAEIS